MRNPTCLPAVIALVHRPKILAGVALSLALALLPTAAFATTVVAPKFDSLVAQADYVVRAVVKSVTSEWRIDGSNRHIMTKVKLDVREVIKGTPPSPLVLEMLGGRIGQDELIVEGAPRFFVGDEDILFVHGNGHQFFPLVAIMYGQFIVSRDTATGLDLIHRSNGSPLYDVKDVTKPLTAATAAASTAPRPLSATEFATKIRASVAQRQNPAPQNAN